MYVESICCRTNCICPPGAKHKCTERRDILGSVAFVPSVAGLIIGGEVIKDSIKKFILEGEELSGKRLVRTSIVCYNMNSFCGSK